MSDCWIVILNLLLDVRLLKSNFQLTTPCQIVEYWCIQMQPEMSSSSVPMAGSQRFVRSLHSHLASESESSMLAGEGAVMHVVTASIHAVAYRCALFWCSPVCVSFLSSVHSSWPGSTQCAGDGRPRSENCRLWSHPDRGLLQEKIRGRSLQLHWNAVSHM